MYEIKKISLGDTQYPQLLAKIKNPPQVIYYRGGIQPNEPCMAIVGTRLCSMYGKQVVLDIAGQLAEVGITIVSGLAPGIDAFAHRAALERGKRTIAVLGTGLDEKSIYPKENLNLARKIIENGGCLLSQYPPGTRATRFTFPQRNRIISGLSLGTLVVEAKEKSGSLITADYAFRQKRKVFAVPGSIYALNSKGTHFLIKKGAYLVDSSTDILRELGLTHMRVASVSEETSYNKEEKLIIQALKTGALHVERIIELSKLTTPVIASTLTVLEIKGEVRHLGNNIFSLARPSPQ